MTIAKLIDAFYARCKREKLSPKTLRFYQSRFKLFRKKFGSRPAGSLKSIEIKTFLDESGEGYSASTQHHNAVAVTKLHNWAIGEELIPRPWWQGKLKKPPMGRRERIPTPAEIVLLLRDASQPFRLIYEGLCQSGARPGELCKALIGNVEWDKSRIVLLEHKTAAKTGRPRIIAIGKQFAATLGTAIGDRIDPAAPIFVNSQGRAWSPENLSGMHRRLRDVAGLPSDLVLYCTRHRFCTEALRAGVPLKDVSQLAGHASVTTTEIYLHRD
jgi:integrase